MVLSFHLEAFGIQINVMTFVPQLHWALAVILGLILIAGLIRSYRILKQARLKDIGRRNEMR